MKKVKIIYSGGGARGAYQFGVRRSLEQFFYDKGYQVTDIEGVSIGAYNGLLDAQNDLSKMEEIWSSKTFWQNAIKGKISLKNALLSYLPFREKGFFKRKPIKKILTDQLLNKNIHKNLNIGVVELEQGKYYSISSNDFLFIEDFSKAIIASGVMPAIWQPVENIQTKSFQIKKVVDGGLRNVSPLSFGFDGDLIVIINTRNSTLGIPKKKVSNNMHSVLKRSLVDIAIDEIFSGEVKSFIQVNDLLYQTSKKGISLPIINFENKWEHSNKNYKPVKIMLIEPRIHLGDSLYFGLQSTDKSIGAVDRIKEGKRAASVAVRNFNLSSKEQSFVTNHV